MTQIYRPDVDGLRAVAVLAVLAFHAFPQLAPGGFAGVDVFFVISGFLISGIVLEGLRDGSFSFAEFYWRRVRRIFPALVLVLLACLAIGGVFGFLLFRQRRAQAAAVFSDAGGSVRLNLDELTKTNDPSRLLDSPK